MILVDSVTPPVEPVTTAVTLYMPIDMAFVTSATPGLCTVNTGITAAGANTSFVTVAATKPGEKVAAHSMVTVPPAGS